jgi:hypothetical protein
MANKARVLRDMIDLCLKRAIGVQPQAPHLGLLAGCGGACRLAWERFEAAASFSFLVDFGSRRIRDASDAEVLPVVMELPFGLQHRQRTSDGRASGSIVARTGPSAWPLRCRRTAGRGAGRRTLRSGRAQTPERGDFPTAGRRQWIARIAGLRMPRTDVQALANHEPTSVEKRAQFVA